MTLFELKEKLLLQLEVVDLAVSSGDLRMYEKPTGHTIESIVELTPQIAADLYIHVERYYTDNPVSHPLLKRHIEEIIIKIDESKKRCDEFLAEAEAEFEVIRIKFFENQHQKHPGEIDLNILINTKAYKKFRKRSCIRTHTDSLAKLLDNLNFLNAQIEYKSTKKRNLIPEEADIPDLQNIFMKNNDYIDILKRLKENGNCTFDRNTGSYEWIKGKEDLAALAMKLRETHKLKKHSEKYPTDNNQFLRKVFCNFFNTTASQKTWSPDRVNENQHKKNQFNFIRESPT